MDEPSPEIWLARHGETAWSRDWLHTSVTDVPLTERGVEQARDLGRRLAGRSFALVLTSPRLRARRTAELAGFPDAVVDDDLVEWHYGSYEGVIDGGDPETVPGWTVWTIRPPEARRPTTSVRAPTACIERARGAGGDVLLFGHAHALRVLGRPLARPGRDGRPPVPARHGVDLRARLRARDAGDPQLERLSRRRAGGSRPGARRRGRRRPRRRAPSRRRACARPRRAASRRRRSARPPRAGGRRARSSGRGRPRRAPGRPPHRRRDSRSPPRRPRARRRAPPKSPRRGRRGRAPGRRGCRGRCRRRARRRRSTRRTPAAPRRRRLPPPRSASSRARRGAGRRGPGRRRRPPRRGVAVLEQEPLAVPADRQRTLERRRAGAASPRRRRRGASRAAPPRSRRWRSAAGRDSGVRS